MLELQSRVEVSETAHGQLLGRFTSQVNLVDALEKELHITQTGLSSVQQSLTTTLAKRAPQISLHVLKGLLTIWAA